MDNKPQVEITDEDLMSMHEIIRAVSTRGAFRAEELLAVGMLFDKLTKYLIDKNALRQITTPNAN